MFKCKLCDYSTSGLLSFSRHLRRTHGMSLLQYFEKFEGFKKELDQYMVSYIMERVQIDPETGCWNWVLHINDNGYGFYSGNAVYRRQSAHTLSYRIFKGCISEDLQINHLCMNRKCVNPLHLEMVTAKENVRYSIAHGRPAGRKTIPVSVNGKKYESLKAAGDDIGCNYKTIQYRIEKGVKGYKKL